MVWWILDSDITNINIFTVSHNKKTWTCCISKLKVISWYSFCCFFGFICCLCTKYCIKLGFFIFTCILKVLICWILWLDTLIEYVYITASNISWKTPVFSVCWITSLSILTLVRCITIFVYSWTGTIHPAVTIKSTCSCYSYVLYRIRLICCHRIDKSPASCICVERIHEKTYLKMVTVRWCP